MVAMSLPAKCSHDYKRVTPRAFVVPRTRAIHYPLPANSSVALGRSRPFIAHQFNQSRSLHRILIFCLLSLISKYEVKNLAIALTLKLKIRLDATIWQESTKTRKQECKENSTLRSRFQFPSVSRLYGLDAAERPVYQHNTNFSSGTSLMQK